MFVGVSKGVDAYTVHMNSESIFTSWEGLPYSPYICMFICAQIQKFNTTDYF